MRLLLVVLCLPLTCFAADPADVGLEVPDGFNVSLYAGDDLAHDIYSMTIDAQGRVVVAGRDYVKILADDDQDGKADRAILFSKIPKSGCHGMFFKGDDLICTGDGGLWRIKGEDGKGEVEDEPELLATMRDPEHGANGIVKGPDGWYYIICGNDAGITEKHATTPGSPVKKPQSGTLVRMSPDGKQSEIVAHGFRNPYDLDFNAQGHIFTVDSDGERDHHLPWYAPTRLFDIYPGMHHGWVLNGWQRSWSRPATYFDNVPRVAELGRGSPTGLTVYRHTLFPPKYQGGVFSCCWTLGRVYFLPLTPKGSSYTSERETFLQTTGEVGFAPVDIAVGPAGEMYVAIGGRRTRGSVFRITANAVPPARPEPNTPLEKVLAAPQPLASWSRAKWEPLVRQLAESDLISAIANDRLPVDQRVRAVEVLTEFFPQPKLAWSAKQVESLPTEVVARIAWSLGRKLRGEGGLKLLTQLTHDERPLVARAAFEALAGLPNFDTAVEAANWEALESGERAVRAAAFLTEARRGPSAAELKVDPLAKLWIKHFRGQLNPKDFAPAAQEFLRAAAWPRKPAEALDAIRLMELSLGDIDTTPMKQDVYSGYALRADAETIARVSKPYHAALGKIFGEVERHVDYELARLCAMLGVDDSHLRDTIIAARCTEESDTKEDLHFLICLSHLPGKRSEKTTHFTALALAHLKHKMRDRDEYPSRNWPERVLEAFENLLEHDPNLGAELLEIAEFSHPDNAFLARKLAPKDRLAATRLMLKRGPSIEEPDERWNESLVALVGELPFAEAVPALREANENYALRDEVLKQLAKEPRAEDRAAFVKGLGSVNPQTVITASQALLKLDAKDTDADLAAAAAALRQACTTPDYINVRRNVVKLLNAWTDEEFAIEESPGTPLLTAYQPIFTWLAKNRPGAWEKVAALGGATADEWQARLQPLDWTRGNAEQGKLVFQKRACVKCHAGATPLGPDLAGAAARFSREDLFTAIVDPNKDVAPLYQTTQIVTRSGRSVHGLVVYESPDGTLLQIDPENTVRIAGDEIQIMKKSRQSLMPTGLLNGTTDSELIDLYAYLRTLVGKK